LNEDTNGLIRWFFRKGSKLEGITEKMVSSTVFKHLLNRRPIKTLNYTTPQEEFFRKIFGVDCALQG
jgi:IS30 family transposase